MQQARFRLWCCVLLLLAGIGTVVTAAISDEGKRAIEQLRQRHQSAEAEPARPKMRDLAGQLRQKHKNNKEHGTPQIFTAPTAAPFNAVEPPRPVAEIEPPAVAAEVQAAESAVTDELTAADTCGDGDLPAEKYDHLPYPVAPEKKPQLATTYNTKQTAGSDNTSFSGFFAAVIAVIALFTFGSAFAGSGGRGSPPGALQAAGTLMLLGAILVGGVTVIKFWPILLLLFFGYVFSQSGRSANDSGCCGCGCGLILLLLLLGII